MRPQARDYTVVYLTLRQWNRLKFLVNRPLGKHKSGGYQNRSGEWKANMDEADHTVLLSHQTDSPRKTDDMTFIAHAIENRWGGGWQADIFEVFAGTHPRFTNLTIRPRRR